MEKQINNFNSFINRGDIRKKADNLLDVLSIAYLRNIDDDNREEIKQRLDDIKKSGIDWGRGVVKSVREKYKQLTNDETINQHMSRW